MWVNFYCYLDFLFYFFKGTKNYIGESYLIFMGPTSKINLKYICFFFFFIFLFFMGAMDGPKGYFENIKRFGNLQVIFHFNIFFRGK